MENLGTVKITRRSFLRTATLGTVALTIGSTVRAQNAMLGSKPNLLVFLPDQQRADTLACYGGSPKLTPNLNKLASQSAVFQQACVAQPVCTPSRSSLLTGTWPSMNGCLHNSVRLPAHQPCLPELLGDSDYDCAYMGKWHLGREVFAQHGFNEWISIMEDRGATLDGMHATIASDYDHYLASQNLTPDNPDTGVFSRRFGAQLPLELSKPKFLEDKVCQFLEQSRRRPFVLFVAFYEPHPPYNGPLNAEHPLNEIALDPTADLTFDAVMPLRYRLRQEWDVKKHGASRAKQLKIRQRYLGLVTEVDRTIGVVLDKLEQLGIADNTIVVHTSDHGDMMGAHQLFGKEVMFEEAIRVPWLVRLPNQRRAFSIAQRISHIDFVPTVLDLLGKSPVAPAVGQSRVPLLRGQAMPPETVFVQWNPTRKAKVTKTTKLAGPEEIKLACTESTRTAISADGWKLCLRDHDTNELYNLRADPNERHNLFGVARQEPVVSRLRGEIHRWQEKIGDSIQV